MCCVGGVLGLPCQRVGDVGPARQEVAVLVLGVVASGLLPVEPRGLSDGECGAVRGSAVAQTAAAVGAGQVRGHGVCVGSFLGRPPLRPLRRAARALAVVVAEPPFDAPARNQSG